MGRAGRAASGFAALGVAARDAIAVGLRNDFPFLEASYAAQRLGAYSVPEPGAVLDEAMIRMKP